MGRIALVVAVVLVAGCATHTVRTVDMTPPQQTVRDLDEHLLLDVGVAVFDPNIPEDYDERIERSIAPEVRRAEANYMAYFLKNLLQSTGNWGAVRVTPRPTHAIDVMVESRIEHSDGERLEVRARVVDATGSVWFTNDYEALASRYAYGESIPDSIDPFQQVYKQIADDMLAYFETLDANRLQRIRTVAEMKFARDFSPDAFEDYVTVDEQQRVELVRLPAESDPNLVRVRKVREREYLFIDTLDEYFAEFNRSMGAAYDDWREASYDEAIAYKELKAQSTRRTVGGLVAIAAGIAAQGSENSTVNSAGTLGIIGGAMILKSALAKRQEAEMHAEVLQELGVSAEAEVSPHTIELENQTVSLSGTVDAQYEELRRVLREIYYEELGLPVPVAEADVSESDVDPVRRDRDAPLDPVSSGS